MLKDELQIVWNIVCICVIPVLVGIILRLIFMKKQKGWIVSAVLSVLAVATGVVAIVIPSHGSEANGLLAYGAVLAAAGSLVCGGIIRLVRKLKNR